MHCGIRILVNRELDADVKSFFNGKFPNTLIEPTCIYSNMVDVQIF
jgi:hypothetical protein